MVNFDTYLKSVCDTYAQWGIVYTLTDVVGERRVKAEPSPLLFDLNLMVQLVLPAQENARERQQKGYAAMNYPRKKQGKI